MKMGVPIVAVGVTLLALLAGVGISGSHFEANVDTLWIKTAGQVRDELDYIDANSLSKTRGNHIMIAVDKTDDTKSVLSKAALQQQASVVEQVSNISVDFEVASRPGKKTRFYTDDVCVSAGPTPYMYQCQRITAVDCFKEGEIDQPASHKSYLRLSTMAGLMAQVTGGIAAEVENGATTLQDRSAKLAAAQLDGLASTSGAAFLASPKCATPEAAPAHTTQQKAAAFLKMTIVGVVGAGNATNAPVLAAALAAALGQAALGDPSNSSYYVGGSLAAYNAAVDASALAFFTGAVAQQASTFTDEAKYAAGMKTITDLFSSRASALAPTATAGQAGGQATTLATLAIGGIIGTDPTQHSNKMAAYGVSTKAAAAHAGGLALMSATDSSYAIDAATGCATADQKNEAFLVATLHSLLPASTGYAGTALAVKHAKLSELAASFGAHANGGPIPAPSSTASTDANVFITELRRIATAGLGWADTVTRAQIAEWAADSSKLVATIQNTTTDLVTLYSSSNAAYAAGVSQVAAGYAATLNTEAKVNALIHQLTDVANGGLFYGRRPSLADPTLTDAKFMNTISGECKLWDDPFFNPPLIFVPPKQLSIGGVQWDTSSGQPAGWDNIKRVENGDATGLPVSGWERTNAHALLKSANAISDAHRTEHKHVVKNRLRGLDAYGVPLKASDLKLAPNAAGSTIVPNPREGAAVVTAYSRRGFPVNVTEDEADKILKLWEEKFQKLGQEEANARNNVTNVYTISANALTTMLREKAGAQVALIVVGYILMCVYTFGALAVSGGVKAGVAGLIGVLFLGLAVAAGFGLSALFGVDFNPLVLQVLPFLLIGIGANDMFVVAFAAISCPERGQRWATSTMASAGPSITMTSITNFVIFLMVRVIGIPVVTSFATIAAISTVVIYLANLLMFPAVFFMLAKSAPVPEGKQCVGVRPDTKMGSMGMKVAAIVVMVAVFAAGAGGVGTMDLGLQAGDVAQKGSRLSTAYDYRLGRFPVLPAYVNSRQYDLAPAANFLKLVSVSERTTKLEKVLSPNVIWSSGFLGWLTPSSDDGKSNAALSIHGGLVANTACSVSNILTGGKCGPKYGCTVGWVEAGKNGVPALNSGECKGADGCNGLDFKDYTNAVAPALFTLSDPSNPNPACVKITAAMATSFVNDASKTDWCMALPETAVAAADAANAAAANAHFSSTGFRPQGPTDNLRTCMPLWIQHDNGAGVITPGTNGKFASVSGAIEGQTTRTSQVDFIGEQGATVAYSAFSIYITGLTDDDEYVKAIKQVRGLLESYTPSNMFFPNGIPFNFWEQYMTLKADLLKWTAIEFVAAFVAIAVGMVAASNVGTVSAAPRAIMHAFVTIILCIMTSVELYGFMAFAGLKMSAIPAIFIWMSAALGIEFTAHIVFAFAKAGEGSRAERTMVAFDAMFAPALHSAGTTLVGMLPLAFSKFAFIVLYMFVPTVLLVACATANSFLLLPALLNLVGAGPITTGGGALLGGSGAVVPTKGGVDGGDDKDAVVAVVSDDAETKEVQL
eukprot:g2283.t1